MWNIRMFSLIVIISILITENQTIKLPDNIKTCSKSDPNFVNCLKITIVESTKKLIDGNVDLGVPKLEPVVAPILDFGETNGKVIKTSKHVYTNIELYKVTTEIMKDLEADFKGDKCFLKYTALIPAQIVVSDYEIKGKIFELPVDGHGKSNLTIYDLLATHHMKCKRNGKHLEATSYTVTITAKSAFFQYENLCDGNPKKSEEILKKINENNGLPLLGDIGPGFANAFAQIWMQGMNSIFSKVPEDDLFRQ